MPVGTRGNQHGVKIVPSQNLLHIPDSLAITIAVMLVDHLFDRLAAAVLHIANGDELHVRLRKKTTEHITAAAADADSSHHNPLTGSDPAVTSQDRAGKDHWCRHSGTGFQDVAQEVAATSAA